MCHRNWDKLQGFEKIGLDTDITFFITLYRELAYQICDQFRALGKPIGLKEAVIIGGLDMMKQSLILAEKPHVVIATPGRLADHLKSTDTFDLKKIKFLVLDEADRLLDPSFSDDLQVIFDNVPTERQTLLFSATLTDTLQELREMSSNDPFYHEVKSEWVKKYLIVIFVLHLMAGLTYTEIFIFLTACVKCPS